MKNDDIDLHRPNWISALGSGVLTFFLAWIVLGIILYVAIPTDPPWEPEEEAEMTHLSNMKGIAVISSAALLGFLRFRRGLRSR